MARLLFIFALAGILISDGTFGGPTTTTARFPNDMSASVGPEGTSFETRIALPEDGAERLYVSAPLFNLVIWPTENNFSLRILSQGELRDEGKGVANVIQEGATTQIFLKTPPWYPQGAEAELVFLYVPWHRLRQLKVVTMKSLWVGVWDELPDRPEYPLASPTGAVDLFVSRMDAEGIFCSIPRKYGVWLRPDLIRSAKVYARIDEGGEQHVAIGCAADIARITPETPVFPENKIFEIPGSDFRIR